MASELRTLVIATGKEVSSVIKAMQVTWSGFSASKLEFSFFFYKKTQAADGLETVGNFNIETCLQDRMHLLSKSRLHAKGRPTHIHRIEEGSD